MIISFFIHKLNSHDFSKPADDDAFYFKWGLDVEVQILPNIYTVCLIAA